MAAWARLCVLAAVSAALSVHGVAAERARFDDEAWAWFSEQIGGGHHTSALQARLPDVDALDIAWTRYLMDLDRTFLAVPDATADAWLARFENQLVRKAWAEASIAPHALLLRSGTAVGSGEGPAALDGALWAHLHRRGATGDFATGADALRDTGADPAMLIWVRHAARLDAKAMELFHVSAHDLVRMADYQLLRKVRTDSHVAAVVSRIRCAGPGAGGHRADCDRARPGLREPVCDQGAAGCDAADAFCRLSRFTGRLCTVAPGRCCRDGEGTSARRHDNASDDASRGMALRVGGPRREWPSRWPDSSAR